MAVEAGTPTLAAPLPPIPLRRRLYGFGSIYGKTVRDSRLAFIVITGVLVGMMLAAGAAMKDVFPTPESRSGVDTLIASIPASMAGLFGNPVKVGTLPGVINWKYGPFFALGAGLWSILALSSTLAGEARRGSLDFAVATPRSRRSIALEKVAGHVAAIAAAMVVVAVATWATGAIFARMAGDPIAPEAAIAFAVGLGVKALIAGSIAFVLAPFIGRGAAAGIAGALMLAGYVVNGYRTVVPAFDSLANATWFSWTAGHLPLAGQSDWPSVGLVALACVALLGLGVEAFARRDIGVTISVPTPALPGALLGLRGPLGRSFGDLLPAALAWGVGVGLYGFVMAATSRPFSEALASTPGLADAVRGIIPGIDMTTTAGFLQLAFTELGFVLVGLAAATLVAVRSSDETAGRLELQLTTPLSRARWAVASAAAVVAAIAVITVVLGASIGAGVAAVGDDPVQPAAGTLVLALYGAALAGVGAAVAGVFGAWLAAPTVLALAIGTFLVDLLAPALRLPDWVEQLALTAHLGKPMVGSWDGAGIVACLVLAIGGVALAAWGMNRRDVSG